MTETKSRPWPLREALEIAQRMLEGQVDLIEGCIALASRTRQVAPDWACDADFVVFGAVASDTDDLPFGEVRARWSATALGGADAKIKAIIEGNRDAIRAACQHLIERLGPGKRQVTLYRPVGPEELALIEASGWRAFPPRLADQPIFYPVTNEAYAIQIARDWNVKASGAGFVTRFEIDGYFLSRYRVEQVGAAMHTEYWIPAEDLAEFNRNLKGPIVVTSEFSG